VSGQGEECVCVEGGGGTVLSAGQGKCPCKHISDYHYRKVCFFSILHQTTPVPCCVTR
jgi:hypothetical protein